MQRDARPRRRRRGSRPRTARHASGAARRGGRRRHRPRGDANARRRRPSTRCSVRCPPVESRRARLDLTRTSQLQPVRVRLGHHRRTGDRAPRGRPRAEGTEVVTNVTTGNETTAGAAQGGIPVHGRPAAGAAASAAGGGGGGGGNRGGGGRWRRRRTRASTWRTLTHVTRHDVSDRVQGARPQQDAHRPDHARHDHRRVGRHHARRDGQRRARR